MEYQEKKCSKCQEVKPIEEFHKNKSNKDGHSYWCSICTREISNKEYGKQYREDHKNETAAYGKKYRETHNAEIVKQREQYYAAHRSEAIEYSNQYYITHRDKTSEYREIRKNKITEGCKVCTKCKVSKPIEEFSKNKTKKTGTYAQCKSCRSEDTRQYNINNPEYQKQYRINNPEKEKARAKKYFINNFEKEKEYHRGYYRNNPEKMHGYCAKRRALVRNSTVENVDLLQLYKNHKWVCGICGLKIDRKLKCPNPMSISHDHIIPISKGGSHTYNNIQPAHLGCNIRKFTKINNIQLVLQTAWNKLKNV